MASLPFLLAKQEVPAFFSRELIDLCHFQILIFTILFGIQRNTLLMGKRHESIKKEGGKYMYCHSCLASDTGSDEISDFTIMFGISINPLPVKTALTINCRQ